MGHHVEDPADGVGVADQLTLVLSDIGFDRKGTLEEKYLHHAGRR